MWFFPTTVDGILRSFHKTINKLEALHSTCSAAAEEYLKLAKENNIEGNRAQNIAEKLKQLID